jgi:hypothetical protein
MSSPEQPSDQPKEQEPTPYYLASRFQNERPAKKAYFQAQKVIYSARNDVGLSAYRFLLNRLSHVAVIGAPPPDAVEKKIKRILASGAITALPDDVLRALMQRRAAATRAGPWVEGHYRPGIQVYPDDNDPAP